LVQSERDKLTSYSALGAILLLICKTFIFADPLALGGFIVAETPVLLLKELGMSKA
jgi:hypothetical protein